MPEKTALITGITGQDGSYLLELLQTKGYEVHGIVRPQTVRSVADNNLFRLHVADLTDSEAVTRVVQSVKPDECYHLAAQTFVPGHELESVRVNVDGTLILLQAIASHSPRCHVFYAGSSEMFGDVRVCPQDETTPFHPRNVYGVSKVAGFHLMALYRTKYKLFASCGILYNHESPRRSSQFLARKITVGIARIRSGASHELCLGNLDAVRDWGHARDYVRAMWLSLQQSHPDDYVIASGHGRSVKEFLEKAFRAGHLDWQSYVRESPEYYRPAEDVPLIGCSRKAREKLGWIPETSFEDLVSEMVAHDLNSYRSGKT
jgi:GDPmannose 4,6-dehydratase